MYVCVCASELVELTVPFEDNFADAQGRKRDRYTDLLRLCTSNGYRAQLITIQIGSRGVLDLSSLSRLKQMCKPTVRVWNSFLVSLAKSAISGSFAIWCSQNTK